MNHNAISPPQPRPQVSSASPAPSSPASNNAAGHDRYDADMPSDIDGRQDERVTLLIRPAKLITGRGEFLAVIRDVSSSGLCLRFFHPGPSDHRCELELRSGQRHRLDRVWGREMEAGFRFHEPTDLRLIVSEKGPYGSRHLRFSLDLAVQLRVRGASGRAQMLNLSQQGALVRCDQPLATEQRLILTADGLPEIEARVRWCRGDLYGLVLDTTISMRELACFVATLQGAGNHAAYRHEAMSGMAMHRAAVNLPSHGDPHPR
ncbi:hypothetical protein HME9302_02468 [Alteripontixanthobacter maritimus]|uniref:PilZ domain-containing protein n=1 Tax=Alteripontixanthobacter maritimus TaxID=2161824 RepID=A0A369QDC8_9SPHN|nr:PilZ domain-containing protein [Alteripontixanthobacter maritimus]RDC61247.1 hypothetical protein HME9302_02468 [Alteripontixanthobacter maritimus]